MTPEELDAAFERVSWAIRNAQEKLDSPDEVLVGEGTHVHYVYSAEFTSILGALLVNTAHLIKSLYDELQDKHGPHIPRQRIPRVDPSLPLEELLRRGRPGDNT